MKNIIEVIETSERIPYEHSINIAKHCSRLLSSGKKEQEAMARKISIHILNKWSSISKDTYPIWLDIIESIGFYPYLDNEKNNEVMSFKSLSDEIRQKSFMSEYLNDKYLHLEQKKISDYIIEGKNVIASAPTSFGKSLLIEEIVASGKYKNIVIIQPTLALLDETRLKLKKYNNSYKIIVRTTQRISEDKGNLFLLTAERVMEYETLPTIDFLVIDEFYKLSLKRSDERADALNNAFLKIVGSFKSKFYFLGPNIDGISSGFAEKYNAIFYKSDYSLVDCNIIDMTDKINITKPCKSLEKEKIKVLYQLLDSLANEQTLIYCSTPSRARRIAKGYYDYILSNGKKPYVDLPLVEWINKNISKQWSLSKELQYGIAIHDGSLQKHIGASVIKYFNDGQLKFLFCTSTIIEGVNTSAKNVILFDGKKGGKQIDYFDYSNIKGRSGRLMEHYVGNIYNFVSPPKKESIFIDIPFFEQNPVTDEVLINIPINDVKKDVLSRYVDISHIELELLNIIKRNGVSINGQINIYNQLKKEIFTNKYSDIAWSQIPTWNNIIYILGVAENNLFSIDNNGISSTKQLAYYLSKYIKNKDIMQIVKMIYNGKIEKSKDKVTNDEKFYDEAIEQTFHIYRHWFQFTVPKTFRVIDSLQRFVCEKYGKKTGSYSYFVQQLENDFIRENLSILTEFGIPASTVRNMEWKIPKDLSEDEVISFIKKNKKQLTTSMLQYEKDKLNQCL